MVSMYYCLIFFPNRETNEELKEIKIREKNQKTSCSRVSNETHILFFKNTLLEMLSRLSLQRTALLRRPQIYDLASVLSWDTS